MTPSASEPARNRVHHLYLAVVAAVVAGAVVGLAAPDFAQELKPVGTAFVDLIKMMISPIIFCTIVLGAGLATLAGGLQSHKPALVDGVGFIVGIDRFMSEARALTNFAGNAVATVVIGTWTREFDAARARGVLTGEDPFNEDTLLDERGPTAEPPGAQKDPLPAPGGAPA